MLRLMRKVFTHRSLLKNLVVRDLKRRYIGSIGGFLWSVIHPVVLLVSYTFIFGVVFRMKLGADFGTNSFAVFIFCGLLPWLLFSDTVVRNCSSILDNAPLITKTVIPAEILPLSITISNFVHHLIGLAILLGVLVTFYGVHLSVMWILLYMIMLLMLAQGLGWIVASLHVFLRDTSQGLQILMLLWFYFTPILYTLDAVPPRFRFYEGLNPMALIVSGYRSSLLNLAQPRAIEIAAVLGISAGVFIAGGLFFRYAKPAFPDVL